MSSGEDVLSQRSGCVTRKKPTSQASPLKTRVPMPYEQRVAETTSTRAPPTANAAKMPKNDGSKKPIASPLYARTLQRRASTHRVPHRLPVCCLLYQSVDESTCPDANFAIDKRGPLTCGVSENPRACRVPSSSSARPFFCRFLQLARAPSRVRRCRGVHEAGGALCEADKQCWEWRDNPAPLWRFAIGGRSRKGVEKLLPSGFQGRERFFSLLM